MESTILIRNTEETLKFLGENGIQVFHKEEHEKLETVQQGVDKFKSFTLAEGGFAFVKNLFLKSKGAGLYLISVHPVSRFVNF